MAIQIRVVPDALRKNAEEIRMLINKSDEIRDEIKVIAKRLDNSWDGEASQQVVQKFQELVKNIDDEKDDLQEEANMLDAVAQRFEAIDDGSEAIAFAQLIQPRILIGMEHMELISLFSSRIRVVPDELREVAGEGLAVGNRLEELIQDVNRIASDLQENWEGKSCNKFIENFKEAITFYKQMANMAEELSKRISFAANRYEEVDNMFG